jgi:phosphatidylethanolamine-binding protein (PEBP) family uncharacterized protein
MLPRNTLAAVAALLALLPAPAFAFSFTVDWKGTAPCFDPDSPLIRLSGVPKGTAKIEFHMTDLDAPNFPHGGGTVAYFGQTTVQRGAFTYKGPCPPEPHRYRWDARALDLSGHELGKAETTVKFPP